MSQTDILFHIVTQHKEETFQLFKFDTVGDLKNEIHERFGILPENQIIESWISNPESDSNTLMRCCSTTQLNVLAVRDASRVSTETGTEVDAIQSFKQYYSENYINNGISFRTCLVADALSRLSFTKKVLVLYFHNKKDNFASNFCQALTETDVVTFVNNKCFLLCWDVEKDEYKSILVEALQKHNELCSFDRFVDRKICAALILVPLEESLTVTNVLKNTMSSEEFLTVLEAADRRIPTNNEQEQEEEINRTFGSVEYQQLMLDMLGDRDYDSFEPSELEHLENKIGYALYGPPEHESGYSDKQKEKINLLNKIILRQNNLVAKWQDRVVITVIYICTEPLAEEKEERDRQFPDYNPVADFIAHPIFVLRKCKHNNFRGPCRIFIDETGRVYVSWEDYLEKNKLPKCHIIYPINGRYEEDQNGRVILDNKLSPACDPVNLFLEKADIAASVGGIASGAAMIAGAVIPAVAAAPLLIPAAAVTGAAAGAYSLGRSAYALFDRHTHQENLSFFDSPEARGAYINIVAGSLGFVGAGANVMVSRLASQGYNFGQGARAAVNAVNIATLGAGGVGIANSSYDVLKNWWFENERPSLLTVVQLSSSILFFGHAVYNYRSINTVIEESQTNTLRDYQESLRSNRHRKAFSKLMKETIRQNKGNVQQGQSEVISTIKNIQNKDEVFATLVRSNKNMNKHGVRFAAKNGEITLNGKAVDMTQFSNLERNEVITFLTQLPGKPNPTTPNVRNMTTYIQNSFGGVFSSTDLARLAMGLASMFANTDGTITEKILNAAAKLLSAIRDEFMEELNRIFPNHEKFFRLCNMVSGFFQKKINEMEMEYQRWCHSRRDYQESRFVRMSINVTKRAVEMFHIIAKQYFNGNILTENGLRELLDYFRLWFTREVFLHEERMNRRNLRRERSTNPGRRITCTVCGGYYFSLQL